MRRLMSSSRLGRYRVIWSSGTSGDSSSCRNGTEATSPGLQWTVGLRIFRLSMETVEHSKPATIIKVLESAKMLFPTELEIAPTSENLTPNLLDELISVQVRFS